MSVSIVYAVPVGGQREHKFNNGSALANHVAHNNMNLFDGVPHPNNPNFGNIIAGQRQRGWSMNWRAENRDK